MAKEITEQGEIRRLTRLYRKLPKNKFAIAQGLIAQAARIRVSLDKLAADLEENGLTELFQQSDKVEPYRKTRAEADLFVKLDKNYQTIIRQLNDMLPPDEVEAADELAEFRNG